MSKAQHVFLFYFTENTLFTIRNNVSKSFPISNFSASLIKIPNLCFYIRDFRVFPGCDPSIVVWFWIAPLEGRSFSKISVAIINLCSYSTSCRYLSRSCCPWASGWNSLNANFTFAISRSLCLLSAGFCELVMRVLVTEGTDNWINHMSLLKSNKFHCSIEIDFTSAVHHFEQSMSSRARTRTW